MMKPEPNPFAVTKLTTAGETRSTISAKPGSATPVAPQITGAGAAATTATLAGCCGASPACALNGAKAPHPARASACHSLLFDERSRDANMETTPNQTRGELYPEMTRLGS